jgi:hypothetical protein
VTVTYDPGRVAEGTVLLAGQVVGAGMTFFRTEAEALKWLLQPLDKGGFAVRPGRRIVRFQVAELTELRPVLPPGPYLEEA